MKTISSLNFRTIALLGSLAAVAGLLSGPASAGDVIEEWASVKAPPPPAIKPVTPDPKTTALLMLDFVQQGCNAKRPRCLESIPAVAKLLSAARAKTMTIIFTGFGKAQRTDILQEVAPVASEPYLVAFLNKYLGTDLEKMLKEQGIQTVITVGTAAHGAVITTASESASRGFSVIVPVDGMSAENTYAEQYTAWHLVNAPVIAPRITLTKTDMVKF